MTHARPGQVWEHDIRGRTHRVEASGSVNHRVRWWVDGVEVASKTSTQEKIRLRAVDQELLVIHSTMGTPHRATVAGIDLTPHPGSRAAAFEQRVLDHPNRYAALAGLSGVGKVVVPIVVTALVGLVWRLVRPLLPDLPAIPWPDLPDLPAIPWPDLPSIPWPDLPDVHPPGWLAWLLDNSHYVVPVVIALVLARREIKRRRTQDAVRRAARGDGDQP